MTKQGPDELPATSAAPATREMQEREPSLSKGWPSFRRKAFFRLLPTTVASVWTIEAVIDVWGTGFPAFPVVYTCAAVSLAVFVDAVCDI